MLKFLKYLLLALILLLVFMASALLSMRFAIHGREVKVPTLAGLTPVEAERKANAEGLVISIESRFYSPDVPAGHIASQVPAAGSTVRRGWKILLSQSLGPQHAAIPNVAGQSELAADINLRRRGLEPGNIASIHLPGAAPQTVVAQSPPPDAKNITSPRVNLIVVAPDNAPRYVMPNFVNKPLVQAAAAVQEAGLTLGGKWGALARAASAANSTVGISTHGATDPPAQAHTQTHSQSHAQIQTQNPIPLQSQTKDKPPPQLTGIVVKQYPLPGQRVTAGTEVYFEVKQLTPIP